MYPASGVVRVSLAMALVSPAGIGAARASEFASPAVDGGKTTLSAHQLLSDRWRSSGTWDNGLGTVRYRLSTKSLKANVAYGRLETELQMGYSGKLRVEARVPTLSGNVSLNVTAESEQPAVYLLQYRQDF
jgi:hypothetical protein